MYPTRDNKENLISRADPERTTRISGDGLVKDGPSPRGAYPAKIGPMRRRLVLMVILQIALLAGLWAVVRDRRVPLGVRGEWEWPRLVAAGPNLHDLGLAVVVVAGYAGFTAAGMRSLGRRAGPIREAGWLAGLVGGAVVVQYAALVGAPEGYGPEKVPIVLWERGSSGYYTVAARQARDPLAFWAAYPGWVRRQDVLHIGTHPPGLILATAAALRTMRARPGLAKAIAGNLPPRVEQGFRELGNRFGPIPQADRAALALIGGLTLLACAATVAPLYYLARSSLPPPAAWASAALWPLAASALLFLPAADVAFPFLAAAALACAARGRAIAAGGMLAIGMGFTLAFLPVGLAVALVLATAPGASTRRRLARIAATGAGFLALTLAGWAVSGADPFVIWRWNLANHARFYATYPRSHAAWALVAPLDLAAGLGLPAACWVVAGFASRKAPRGAWAALAVLVLLDLSGRNRGEVARLWLPFMPLLLPAAGAGFARLGAGPGSLAATVGLLGVQVLMLQAMIQVVYVLGA